MSFHFFKDGFFKKPVTYFDFQLFEGCEPLKTFENGRGHL